MSAAYILITAFGADAVVRILRGAVVATLVVLIIALVITVGLWFGLRIFQMLSGHRP